MGIVAYVMGYISPSLLLGALFWLGYSSLAHLGGGRTLRDLVGFLVIGAIGFSVGQLLGKSTQSPFFEIGELHLFEASLTAWLLLAIAILLGRR
ncbi:MAG: hypothetical protein KDE19_09610 [Caldilineaceae bacterium]|nr:hypothetical protein [Caldilineaceae bacterium]